MEHIQTNKKTQEQINRGMIERLSLQQRPKTKAERQKPIYYTMLLVGFFCQIVSFVLASSGVLFLLVENFNSSTGWVLIVLSIILLIIIEGLVFVALKGFHAERLYDKERNVVTFIVLIVSFCFSTPLTYVGTPAAVSLFAANPVLIDLSKIDQTFESTIKADSAKFSEQIAACQIMADSVHSNNSYRGTTVRDARPAEQAYIMQKLRLENDLIDKTAMTQGERKHALKQATIENDRRQAEHVAFCSSFGFWLAWVTVGAMLVLFGVRWYCENWERDFVIEGRIKLEQTNPNQSAQDNIIRIQPKPNKPEQEQPTKKQAVARNPIKFGNEQHGHVFTPQGATKKRVEYEKTDGSFTTYSKADLVRMYKRTSGTEEHKTELERLINLF